MALDSTTEQLMRVSEPASAREVAKRRWLFRTVMGLVALVIGAAVLDGLDVVDLVGPDEAVVRAAGEGYELRVDYPSVTRPALASVFRISVRRDDGFDEPLQIGVSRRFLEAWDLNGVLPATAAERAVGPWIVWEFDPPPGDELVVTYESRIEPGLQSSRDGRVAVFEEDEPVVEVAFDMTVRP